jgi:hypothetical protein
MSDLATELLGPAAQAERPRPRVLAPGESISFTILGQPASKANSRKIVTLARGKENERTAVVKSKEALAYERDALRQIPPAARLRLTGPVSVTLRIWYISERPDLDESIVLDVLQDRWDRPHGPLKGEKKRELVQAGVFRNDRQVRQKHVYHEIDRSNPRTDVLVQPLTGQQAALL